MLGHLLDTLKTLPAGADPTPYYQQYNLTAEDLAGVRRWINSPSVSEETVARVDDAQAQTMEQLVELKVSEGRGGREERGNERRQGKARSND